MENDAKQNYGQGNRNFQDDPNKNRNIGNEGLPTYGKNDDSDSDNSFSNYDDDKKNTEQEANQEGYPDENVFGQKPLERNPDPDDTDIDDDSDYEEDEDDEDDKEDDDEDGENEQDEDDEGEDFEDFEEETNLDDEINPDEKKDFYLRGNGGRNNNSAFDL